MNYEKPELIAAGSAITAIQSGMVKDASPGDISQGRTNDAYVSDEA